MNPVSAPPVSDLTRHPLRLRRVAVALLLVSIATPQLGATAAENGERLGTLFYSPVERLEITHARGDLESSEAEAPTRLQLDGLVKRGGGKSTAWLNGKPVAEGLPVAQQPAPVINKAGVAIDGKPLRIGESLNLTTGERSDFIPQGTFTANNPP